jgi:hypothetical protein
MTNISNFLFAIDRQTAIGLNITKILNQFFDNGYDKRVRPNYAGMREMQNNIFRILTISLSNNMKNDYRRHNNNAILVVKY